MNFLIADTFTDSLARLTGEEQKAVKTTAFDLHLNPASPGMSFHKLDRAKDKNFWSVRVSSDIRLIVHRSESSLLLCYVDHHDKAYEWAERRKLETHPTTGAAQLIEIRETLKEVIVPVYVQAEPPLETSTTKPAPAAKLLFQSVPDGELLGYGVPPEWLADVRHATDENLLAEEWLDDCRDSTHNATPAIRFVDRGTRHRVFPGEAECRWRRRGGSCAG